MDFSSFSDAVFLKIAHFLKFDDRVRIGRVNKAFRRISTMAISETKILESSYNSNFAKISAPSFSKLLDLCSQNLEKVDFFFDEEDGVDRLPLIKVMTDYSFPKLSILRLNGIRIQNNHLAILLKKNPNIETLSFNTAGGLKFPNVVWEKMECLKIDSCNTATFRSMVDHFPNLKKFEAEIDDVSIKWMDAFFGSCPDLEKVELNMSENRIKFERLVKFWGLKSMKELSLMAGNNDEDMEDYEDESDDDADSMHGSPLATDICLQKIGTSFPLLKSLNLSFCRVTKLGIEALRNLEHLSSIFMFKNCALPFQRRDAIRALAKCQALKYAYVSDENLDPETMITLIQSCPQLVRLSVYSVDTQSQADPIKILNSCIGSGKKKIEISFGTRDKPDYRHWKASSVMAIMKKLKEEHGIRVVLDWNNFPKIEY